MHVIWAMLDYVSFYTVEIQLILGTLEFLLIHFMQSSGCIHEKSLT